MPEYDYECDKCGHQFIARHSMKDEYKDGCPECSHKKVHRIFISTPQINMGTNGGISPRRYGGRR